MALGSVAESLGETLKCPTKRIQLSRAKQTKPTIMTANGPTGTVALLLGWEDDDEGVEAMGGSFLFPPTCFGYTMECLCSHLLLLCICMFLNYSKTREYSVEIPLWEITPDLAIRPSKVTTSQSRKNRGTGAETQAERF